MQGKLRSFTTAQLLMECLGRVIVWDPVVWRIRAVWQCGGRLGLGNEMDTIVVSI